jgi:two-component SAPR family response regulator|tara:strand:- start:49 stop:351 length:303 start_codon:yes stop_codon:yes gene_type:complete
MAAQKNPTTKETLQLIEYQIEQIFKEINNLNEDNKTAHTEVKKDLRFIKQNLFDPNEGIWAEVKQNSNFRKDTIKWRSALGLGVFSLIGKQMYDFFKSLS